MPLTRNWFLGIDRWPEGRASPMFMEVARGANDSWKVSNKTSEQNSAVSNSCTFVVMVPTMMFAHGTVCTLFWMAITMSCHGDSVQRLSNDLDLRSAWHFTCLISICLWFGRCQWVGKVGRSQAKVHAGDHVRGILPHLRHRIVAKVEPLPVAVEIVARGKLDPIVGNVVVLARDWYCFSKSISPAH